MSGSADETALILAAKNGNRDVVELLVEYDANVNVKWGEKYGRESTNINSTIIDSSGQMVLMLAAEWQGNPDIIKVLFNGGADVNAKGKKYIQHNLRKLTPLLQVPPVKQHFSLWRREESGTSLTLSSIMVLM